MTFNDKNLRDFFIIIAVGITIAVVIVAAIIGGLVSLFNVAV